MEVSCEKINGYLRKLAVKVEAEEVDRTFTRSTTKLLKAAVMPGFRPGKIPRSLFERQSGARIEQEVLSDLVEASLKRAMDGEGLRPVGRPQLSEVGQLQRGSAFSYAALVEVAPEVTLKQWRGLEVEADAGVVPEEAVDKALEERRREQAELVPVEGRDEVCEGDVVLLDYEGTLEGAPFAGGHAEGSLIEAGPGHTLPDFWRGMLGAKVPGTRTIDVTFPADYNSPQLAGKTAQFKLQLRELKARQLAAVDDAFAQDLGEPNLAALRAKLRAEMEATQAGERAKRRRRLVLEKLVATNPFEVPPAMVDAQADELAYRAAAQLQGMMGDGTRVNDEMLANLRRYSMDDAAFQVRSGLLLMEVSKAEGLSVSDAELEAGIEASAAAAGGQADAFRAYYRADPQRREQLRLGLLEDKAIAHLLQLSTPAPAHNEKESAP